VVGQVGGAGSGGVVGVADQVAVAGLVDRQQVDRDRGDVAVGHPVGAGDLQVDGGVGRYRSAAAAQSGAGVHDPGGGDRCEVAGWGGGLGGVEALVPGLRAGDLSGRVAAVACGAGARLADLEAAGGVPHGAVGGDTPAVHAVDVQLHQPVGLVVGG